SLPLWPMVEGPAHGKAVQGPFLESQNRRDFCEPMQGYSHERGLLAIAFFPSQDVLLRECTGIYRVTEARKTPGFALTRKPSFGARIVRRRSGRPRTSSRCPPGDSSAGMGLGARAASDSREARPERAYGPPEPPARRGLPKVLRSPADGSEDRYAP